MRHLVTCTFLFFTLSSCAQSGQMPMAEFSTESLTEGSVLVDVRTPEEFQAGHIPGAVNIDWYSEDFAERWSDIPRESKVFVYCKAGGRSARAAQRLAELGYENVVDLTGGYSHYSPPE